MRSSFWQLDCLSGDGVTKEGSASAGSDSLPHRLHAARQAAQKVSNLICVNQFDAYSADRVRIHVVILARTLFANVSPRSRLPHVIAQLLVLGCGLSQVVHGHAQVL